MDVTVETFEEAVVERSRELPVVVDFWAAWCGPCRMLAPALESEVAKRAGNLELVKIDLDGEVDERARRHRHPRRIAVQLAGELGDDEADRLCRSGRGGDDVQSRGTRPPQVLVRQVDEALVGRVRVHGRHQPVPDPEGLGED